MKNLLIALGLSIALTSVYAADEAKKEPAKATKPAMPKVEVQKPCKAGQTPEKDKCREPNKIEKKK